MLSSPKKLHLLPRVANEMKLGTLSVIMTSCLLGCTHEPVQHRQTTIRRFIFAIEEAGRYLDCSRGRTEFFLTSTLSGERILVDLTTEQDRGKTMRLLALVEEDGRLSIFGRSEYRRTPSTSLKPLAQVFKLMADMESDRIKVEFSAILTREPKGTFVGILSYPPVPDAVTSFWVTGDKVRRLRR